MSNTPFFVCNFCGNCRPTLLPLNQIPFRVLVIKGPKVSFINFVLNSVSSCAIVVFSFFQKSPYIHALSAKPTLNQNDQSIVNKITW